MSAGVEGLGRTSEWEELEWRRLEEDRRDRKTCVCKGKGKGTMPTNSSSTPLVLSSLSSGAD